MKTTPSVFVYNIPGAVRLRTALPTLWPFLAVVIKEPSPRVPDAESLARATLKCRNDWLIALHRADVLGQASSDATRELGFDSPATYRKLAEDARGPVPSQPYRPDGDAQSKRAWLEMAAAASSPAKALDRLQTYLQTYEEELRKLSKRIDELQSESIPAPYPVPDARVNRRSTRASVPSNRSREPAGVAFDLIRTGVTEDGRPLHRAVAVYQFPTELPIASAEPCKPTDQSKDPGELVLECADTVISDDGRSHPIGHSTVRKIPLGLVVDDVVVEANGNLRSITPAGVSNVTIQNDEAQAALSTFGFPELFSDAEVDYKKISSDLKTLEMSVRPKLLGLTMSEFQVALLRGGSPPERAPREQILTGLKSSLESTASEDLADFLEPLRINKKALGATVSLDVDEESVKAVLLGAGEPQTNGEHGLSMRVQITSDLALKVVEAKDG